MADIVFDDEEKQLFLEKIFVLMVERKEAMESVVRILMEEYDLMQ